MGVDLLDSDKHIVVSDYKRQQGTDARRREDIHTSMTTIAQQLDALDVSIHLRIQYYPIFIT